MTKPFNQQPWWPYVFLGGAVLLFFLPYILMYIFPSFVFPLLVNFPYLMALPFVLPISWLVLGVLFVHFFGKNQKIKIDKSSRYSYFITTFYSKGNKTVLYQGLPSIFGLLLGWYFAIEGSMTRNKLMLLGAGILYYGLTALSLWLIKKTTIKLKIKLSWSNIWFMLGLIVITSFIEIFLRFGGYIIQAVVGLAAFILVIYIGFKLLKQFKKPLELFILYHLGVLLSLFFIFTLMYAILFYDLFLK